MSRRLSETLIADAGHICCATCSHRLAPANGGWKRSAALSTVAVAALPGAGTNDHPEVVLRRFCCPKCGHLQKSSDADAVKKSAVVWDETTLEKWLTDPETVIPDTDMAFRLDNPVERAVIIAFLKETGK